MDDAEQFLPMYLRFVKGIIDSNDLPLNISREILQSNQTVETIRHALVKRVLKMLEKLAKDNVEKYSVFWKTFGKVLKEGPVEDYTNREKIAKLLRFSTTKTDSEAQTVSLDDYISRLQPDQDKIYYVSAETFSAAKNSPHLEIFRERGIEVLLLYDRIDEWLMNHLTQYEEKTFQSVAKGDLDLSKLGKAEKTKEEKEQQANEWDTILKQMQDLLKDEVKEVRITDRLTQSPACVVCDEHEMSAHMQRIMEAAGQAMPVAKPILEINPMHELVMNLKTESDDDRFNDWTHLLFEQAILAEGGALQSPADFVQRMNKLLMVS